MLVQIPLLRRDLVIATHPESLPEVIPPLAVWVISGSATRTARFWRELQNSSRHHGDTNPPRHTMGSGQAGAVNGTVISRFIPYRRGGQLPRHPFTDGYQYHSINSYHSATSSVHEKVDGYEVGHTRWCQGPSKEYSMRDHLSQGTLRRGM